LQFKSLQARHSPHFYELPEPDYGWVAREIKSTEEAETSAMECGQKQLD